MPKKIMSMLTVFDVHAIMAHSAMMAVKPMTTLKLHYPIVQFSISMISSFISFNSI